MLSKNKNRGAGLVTVVVVIAVSSILLSASIWLSFTHYNNIMLEQIKETAEAELDVCAELIGLTDSENLLSVLSDFYQPDNGVVAADGTSWTVSCTDFSIEICKNEFDGKYILKYKRGDFTISKEISI